MKFIKTGDTAIGTEVLLSRLKHDLASGKKVLWLMSGGSNITSEAAILQSLRSISLDNLTLMLMDERYGPIGHPDSNWHQLQAAGCDFSGLNAFPVMAAPEKPLEETVTAYATQITAAMDAADVVIGQFGLGEDGHTAGILPRSPAALETTRLVVGYESPPYVRITLTRFALQRVDTAYVFAYGPAKLPALSRLLHNQEPFAQLPAVLFTELPEVYLYNDQIEGEIS